MEDEPEVGVGAGSLNDTPTEFFPLDLGLKHDISFKANRRSRYLRFLFS